MYRILETILVTFVGGLIFTFLGLPISWMLGPMTASLVWQGLTGRRLTWSSSLRNIGLLTIGYGLGLSFTVESARQISLQFPSMLVATLLTILFSLGIAFVTSMKTGVSLMSCIMGNIPGGMSQMVMMSEEIEDVDTAVVVFMQTIRLLTVIFIVPFLAIHSLKNGSPGGDQTFAESTIWASLQMGIIEAAARPIFTLLILCAVLFAAWGGVKLHLPTPYFLGPIIIVGLLNISGFEPPHLPSIFSLLAQWSLGIYLGVGMKLNSLHNWKRLLPYSIAGSTALVAFSLGLSFIFSKVHPISMLTAFLSTSPGGMTEMGVTASTVGADVSVVVAYQMFRILFILFIIPYALRLVIRQLYRSNSQLKKG
ncbi:AbrB family transcriptional regulator [Paenibacillus crassostreae]|uniref:AbrB family transcriptional regulator n=1 Tax=Paenibacillus crassostreae TaxID=1763538 RepID=A0A167FEF6_9BACL|nr:AbrB family transcriptional regulator [Paenibacillus crassostreae]AOZ90768.1 AbrB family transcriptional regulator [Paenibacillus crassostreae]AOZ94492.1 AbrB family transcriptional regulator [Paenibacillus crassostreae]OAB76467.1 AbrB family transcriptional regulator [Paenibacillus crassostreae]